MKNQDVSKLYKIMFGLFYYDVLIWLIDYKLLQKCLTRGAYRQLLQPKLLKNINESCT